MRSKSNNLSLKEALDTALYLALRVFCVVLSVTPHLFYPSLQGYYFTGDGCRRDADGYYWITGRVDDVINPSGHRLGTAEIESALVACPQVSEAAVVGFPHDVKGEGIGCFVILREGFSGSGDLTKALAGAVRAAIGPIATPDFIVYSDLPKTRSGKIMRRILRKVAAFEEDGIGDISTLADPSIVAKLIDKHREARGPTTF